MLAPQKDRGFGEKEPSASDIVNVLTAHHQGLSIALRNVRGNLQYLPFHQRAGYMTDDDGNAGFGLVVSAAAPTAIQLFVSSNSCAISASAGHS